MKRAVVFLFFVGINFAVFGFNLVDLNLKIEQAENVTATINKETTDEQFDDLKTYLGKYGIIIEVGKISRNSKKEITGLNLKIRKGHQQSSYNMHSNLPISDLELGYKDGDVFIGSVNNNIAFGDLGSLSNLFNSLNQEGGSLDSLLSQEQFSLSFGSDDIQKFLNESSFDLNKIQEQFFGQFFNSKDQSFVKKHLNTPNSSLNIPKYNFFNSKNSNKLIIIDGKESNFEVLDVLAKADKLADVDNLKSSTAVSIYGEKAKDGAIIATTK